MRNIKKLRVASFSAHLVGSPSSIQPRQCCPAGGRNADEALRSANSAASRAAGEGVGGGVNPSPGWLFGDWSWLVGGVGGTVGSLHAGEAQGLGGLGFHEEKITYFKEKR